MKKNRKKIVTLILTSCYVQMYPNKYVFAITLCQAPFKAQEVSRGQNMEADRVEEVGINDRYTVIVNCI